MFAARSSPIRISVHHQLGEVFPQDAFGALQLLGRVLAGVGQLVGDAHGFVLVHAQPVVGQQFHALYLPVAAEVLAQGAQVGLRVAQAGHQDVAQPERVALRLEPGRRTQGLGITAARDVAMAVVIEFLDVKQDQVAQAEEFLHVAVPHAAVAVHADVDAGLLQFPKQGDERLGLHRGLATRKRDAAALAEEGFHADSLLQDVGRVGQLAFADRFNRIGVGAIEAAEGAALQENHEAQARSVEGAHRFVGMYFYE